MDLSVKVFYHRNYPRNRNRIVILQEYALRPFLILFGLVAAMLLYLLARRQAVLWPGIIGIFGIMLLANFFGTVSARGKFLEAGFTGQYFYLRSAYDLAYNKNLKFYPLPYANATREGNVIFLNYIDQTVRLRQEEWDNWHEIWDYLSGARYHAPEA